MKKSTILHKKRNFLPYDDNVYHKKNVCLPYDIITGELGPPCKEMIGSIVELMARSTFEGIFCSICLAYVGLLVVLNIID